MASNIAKLPELLMRPRDWTPILAPRAMALVQ